jgi:hypothetical protein
MRAELQYLQKRGKGDGKCDTYWFIVFIASISMERQCIETVRLSRPVNTATRSLNWHLTAVSAVSALGRNFNKTYLLPSSADTHKVTIHLNIYRIKHCEREEWRLLGYKNPVRTSQETHYFSTTESSQLMLCKIWGFQGSDYEECRLLGNYLVWLH